MAVGLPIVIQDDDNPYVYGLVLISTADSGGVQTYYLYDGLGSSKNPTDDTGSVDHNLRLRQVDPEAPDVLHIRDIATGDDSSMAGMAAKQATVPIGLRAKARRKRL